MNDDGLRSSIWAPRGNDNSSRRPDDWICPSCGFSNFEWRKECFRCSAVISKSDPKVVNGHLPLSRRPSPQPVTSHGDTDSHLLHSTRDASFRTNEQSTASLQENKGFGLSTSRWAPRNYGGRARIANTTEVWTRTIPISKPLQVTPSTTPKPPDLGLPYEVQHYILAMIQRILEEACYDLASRWIPQTLREKGWDCSEAVELSTWKNLLPTALPPNAIIPLPNYSLERALVDAVRIRNAAVHRHLCDNTEIRRMVLQAQDLMSMFLDTTRQNKFHRLWVELNDWDQSYDPQAARDKLQLALRDISERPVDDMDWTPNTVSLQEITAEAIYDQEYHGEEMDLD